MALPNVSNILNKIPAYNYKVGAKDSSSSGFPVNVKVSFDPDFKKTVYTTAGIIALGLIGLGVGSAIGRRKRN